MKIYLLLCCLTWTTGELFWCISFAAGLNVRDTVICVCVARALVRYYGLEWSSCCARPLVCCSWLRLTASVWFFAVIIRAFKMAPALSAVTQADVSTMEWIHHFHPGKKLLPLETKEHLFTSLCCETTISAPRTPPAKAPPGALGCSQTCEEVPEDILSWFTYNTIFVRSWRGAEKCSIWRNILFVESGRGYQGSPRSGSASEPQQTLSRVRKSPSVTPHYSDSYLPILSHCEGFPAVFKAINSFRWEIKQD